MTDWLPSRDLEALLDALTDELLASADHEIPTYFHDDADGRREEVEMVRRLIAGADAGLAVPANSLFKAPGLRAYVARNH